MGKPVENLTPGKPANANDMRASTRNTNAMQTQCAHSEGVVTTPNIQAATKKYACPYCGAEFDSQQALATRMKRHKDMGAPPTPLRSRSNKNSSIVCTTWEPPMKTMK